MHPPARDSRPLPRRTRAAGTSTTLSAAIGPVTFLAPIRALGHACAVFGQVARSLTVTLILVQGLFVLSLLGAPSPSVTATVATVVAITCWYAHAVTLNDLGDRATDTINLAHSPQARERPLVNGSADAGQLRTLATVLAAVSTVATLAVSPLLAPVLVVMFALNRAYSLAPLRLSWRGGWAQAVLPIGYVWVPTAFAWALSDFAPPRPGVWLSVVGLHLMFTGRLMTKDLRDVRGDRAVGKITFVLRHGLRATLVGSGALVTTGVALMVAGRLVLGADTGVEVTLLAIGVGAAIVAVAALSRVVHEPDRWRRVALTGVMGRACTGVVFCLLVASLLPAAMPSHRAVALLIGSAALFATGTWLLADRWLVRRVTP